MGQVMPIIILVILFLFSLLGIFKPKLALRLSDILKIKGEREYTDWAVSSTVFGGVFMATFSATALYFYIDFLINQ
ncbi:MAG: hypothetical protein KQ78_01198 [Candidatus Izimaplasma bacterium HR2]|nr:MAG: hypothetical protein KQ78_01198 [Candidatus Izimaplasma bacterium HR2]